MFLKTHGPHGGNRGRGGDVIHHFKEHKGILSEQIGEALIECIRIHLQHGSQRRSNSTVLVLEVSNNGGVDWLSWKIMHARGEYFVGCKLLHFHLQLHHPRRPSEMSLREF